MSKLEKRIVTFSIILVLTAFGLNALDGNRCLAAPVVTPASTARVEGINYYYKYEVNDDTEIAWDLLREAGYTEAATAAILGNLHYESAMYPYRVENYTPDRSKSLSDYYTESRERFASFYSGYGLAMWTGRNNHLRLWDWCEENGYEVDSLEGQIKFLIADYPYMAEGSNERMKYYELKDLVTATEDFRQSYEKSVLKETSQYARAKWAKLIFASYCEDVDDIPFVNEIPMDFEIYQKVNAINRRYGIKRKGEE